jgi:hypothetical protein
LVEGIVAEADQTSSGNQLVAVEWERTVEVVGLQMGLLRCLEIAAVAVACLFVWGTGNYSVAGCFVASHYIGSQWAETSFPRSVGHSGKD